MLRFYTDNDFGVLEKWVTNAALLFQFSGPDWQFPLTQSVLQDYITTHPERQFYWGISNGVPYAFGEIIRGDANSPRLGRLLIGEEQQRGKGMGQQFVTELLQECMRIDRPEQIFLFVFEDNLRAIRCYRKCGFEFCDDVHARLNHEGKETKVLKMAWRGYRV